MPTSSFRLAPGALLLAAGMLAACGPRASAPEPVRAVRTMTVGATAAPVQREFAAAVHARVESPLGFRVGGKIVARPVNAGDRVRAGQVLAQVDPTDLRLGAASARAALAAAQTNADQTESDLQRFRDLRAQGFISAADLERRESGLLAAKAQLDQARAESGLQANQAGYAALVADAPGVVTQVDADVGAVVAAGTPVLALAHDGPRDVVFSVPEDLLPVVRQLQGRRDAVGVRFWSGDAPVRATVREVAGAADPATRTFLVRADLPPGAASLGQTATATLELAPADGRLRVPLPAVAGRGDRSIVWVLDRSTMTVHERPVTVLRPDGDQLVLADGLRAGDVVVTAGAHVLVPGQHVALYAETAAR